MDRAFATTTARGRKQIVLRKSLPLPSGAWQLFWLGRLTASPRAKQTPFIRAYLARVELCNSRITAFHPEVRHVDLPISDLTALPLGTVFADTTVIPGLPLHPSSTWSDIWVDFTRENIRVTTRLAVEEDGQRFLRRGTRTPNDDTEYEGLLLEVGDSGDGHTYLFPCTTIFQFFWARSSKWAQLMVDGRFVDFNRYVFDARRSFINEGGSKALIWLRQWMLDDDARFIASLAFDPYALEVGTDIYKYLAQKSNQREARCVRALPPYQGTMRLRALLQPIVTKRGPAMLVQSITQCNYSSSIEFLQFDRDNDGRTIDEIAEGVKKLSIERDAFGGPIQSLLDDDVALSDEPPSNQKGIIEIVSTPTDEMFPELAKMSIEKLSQDETSYKNEQERAKNRLSEWSNLVSSLEGALSSEQLAPEALIRAEDHSDEDDPTPVRGDIYQLASTLLTGEPIEFKNNSETWTANVKLADMSRLIGNFFMVPKTVGGVPLAWLYRDKEKRYRKRALCIRVEFSSASSKHAVTRYLLDFEPRQSSGVPRQTRILLFWNDTNTPLDYEERCVRLLIGAIAQKGQAGLSAKEMNGLQGYPRNHPPAHEITRRFLQSMLLATNKT